MDQFQEFRNRVSTMRYARKLRLRSLFGIELLHRIAGVLPRLQAAQQRPDSSHANLLELQRYPSAGSFAGSSTVKDDVAIARNLGAARGQFIGRDAHRGGHHPRIYQELQFMPQVHHKGLFAPIQGRLEILR